MRNSILLFLVVLCVSAAPATRPAGDDIDGTWKSQGMINILGESTDRILEIGPADKPAAKLVTMTRVQNPRFEERQLQPKPIRFGPFEAQVKENTLVVRHPAGFARYSFTIDGGTLNLPAFVRNGDREIFIEASRILDVDDRTVNQPPLVVQEWRWTFSAAPESAKRGTGHFTTKQTPDPGKFSTAFDFEWEWRDDLAGRRIVILRKNDGGNWAESGAFLVGKNGDMRWYSSGGEREGPREVARSYVRVDRPTTGPAVRPQP
jgi:hypothetical protein